MPIKKCGCFQTRHAGACVGKDGKCLWCGVVLGVVCLTCSELCGEDEIWCSVCVREGKEWASGQTTQPCGRSSEVIPRCGVCGDAEVYCVCS